jgi:hypothetical protein
MEYPKIRSLIGINVGLAEHLRRAVEANRPKDHIYLFPKEFSNSKWLVNSKWIIGSHARRLVRNRIDRIDRTIRIRCYWSPPEHWEPIKNIAGFRVSDRIIISPDGDLYLSAVYLSRLIRQIYLRLDLTRISPELVERIFSDYRNRVITIENNSIELERSNLRIKNLLKIPEVERIVIRSRL